MPQTVIQTRVIRLRAVDGYASAVPRKHLSIAIILQSKICLSCPWKYVSIFLYDPELCP